MTQEEHKFEVRKLRMEFEMERLRERIAAREAGQAAEPRSRGSADAGAKGSQEVPSNPIDDYRRQRGIL